MANFGILTDPQMLKRPLASNLKKVRKENDWSQDKAASIIQIPRANLAAYEEDRCQPPAEVLAKICEAYCVQDVISFLRDRDYNPAKKIIHSIIETRFNALSGRCKEAAAVLLGLN